MTDNTVYCRLGLTGGGVDDVDGIDGSVLSNGDMIIAKVGDNVRIYNVDSTSGATENNPRVISFDTNAGNKRAILQGVSGYVTETKWLPIGDAVDGTSAPDAIATYATGVGKLRARTFAGDSSEDVIFHWEPPGDIVADEGVGFRVKSMVTATTGMSAEGLAFSLSGASIGDGDSLAVTMGTESISVVSGATNPRYDMVFSSVPGTPVTIANLAIGETILLKLYRDHDNAYDTHAQKIGVAGLELTYTRLPQKD